MEKPMMMLVNPAAGRSTSDAALGSAVAAFCEAGYCPTVYFTTAPGATDPGPPRPDRCEKKIPPYFSPPQHFVVIL